MTDQRRRAIDDLLRLAERGSFVLPPAVVRALDDEARVTRFRDEAYAAARAAAAGDLVELAAAEVIAAVAEGREVDDNLSVRAAEAEASERLAEVRRRVLDIAAEKAERAVAAAFDGDSIIVEVLRPPFATTMTSVTKAAIVLAGRDLGDLAALLRSPAKVHDAALALLDGVDRFDDLRAAHRVALRLTPPEVDTAGWYREHPDPEALGLRGPGPDPRPAPADRLTRVIWVANAWASGGNAWLPTGAEMDLKVSAYREKMKRERPTLFSMGIY